MSRPRPRPNPWVAWLGLVGPAHYLRSCLCISFCDTLFVASPFRPLPRPRLPSQQPPPCTSTCACCLLSLFIRSGQLAPPPQTTDPVGSFSHCPPVDAATSTSPDRLSLTESWSSSRTHARARQSPSPVSPWLASTSTENSETVTASYATFHHLPRIKTCTTLVPGTIPFPHPPTWRVRHQTSSRSLSSCVVSPPRHTCHPAPPRPDQPQLT